MYGYVKNQREENKSLTTNFIVIEKKYGLIIGDNPNGSIVK